MLNVNQITSQLAKMPDNALQQYATMHKADPYMLALTIAESNRRKEMRSAAQGAQGAMPQPKVADQAIAGMSPQQLPENVGIGALPADNMKGMATGGIVAFEEGGQVPRFADGGMSFDPLTGEAVMDDGAPQMSFLDKLKKSIGYGEGMKIDPRAAINQQKTDEAAAKERSVPFDAATATRRDKFPGYTPLKDEAPAETKKGLGALASAAGQRSGLSGGAGGAGTYKPSTLADMMKEVNPEIEKMNAEDRAAMDPFRKQFEEERSDLAKRKESNKAEALLAAGLGMMSGGSRYALQNIGTGAQQGLTALKEATRGDDAARRALMQSEMHLAQAEMQGRKGNFQNMNALANQARQEKQFATSSELQKQQIANQGAYYNAMAAKAGSSAAYDKMLTQLQLKINGEVDKDMLIPEAQKAQIKQQRLLEAINNHPGLKKYFGSEAPAEPVTREL
jgi:hypothetical protein